MKISHSITLSNFFSKNLPFKNVHLPTQPIDRGDLTFKMDQIIKVYRANTYFSHFSLPPIFFIRKIIISRNIHNQINSFNYISHKICSEMMSSAYYIVKTIKMMIDCLFCCRFEYFIMNNNHYRNMIFALISLP